ncbi:MAG: thiamine-phosphate kinase [Methanomassiliicoccales archaeon]|nr:thiamine-phosphate kinase [Methanomassiliicoccales archaeon]
MKTLADLGEKAVISLLLENVETTAAVGPGDDAAAVDIGPQYLVISTDVVSRASHLPKGMTEWQIGWFAAAVNFSDIAAMGARPVGLVMAYVLPRDMPFEDLKRISQGVRDCCAFVGADLLGGDTKEGEEMVITGTAIGLVDKDRVLLRRGAREGDLLAVTGPIGSAAAGYAAIKRGIYAPRSVKALLEPQPRTREGIILSSSGRVTSCMDITDGLAYSIGELSKQSGVGFEVRWCSIPVGEDVGRVAEKSGMSAEDLVMHFGGDYELLFTLSPEGYDELNEKLGGRLHVIGRASGKGNVLIRDGKVVPLDTRGYEHFR